MIPEHDVVSVMSDDELIAYHQYHSKQAVLKNNGQLVRKILLNVGHFIQ